MSACGKASGISAPGGIEARCRGGAATASGAGAQGGVIPGAGAGPVSSGCANQFSESVSKAASPQPRSAQPGGSQSASSTTQGGQSGAQTAQGGQSGAQAAQGGQNAAQGDAGAAPASSAGSSGSACGSQGSGGGSAGAGSMMDMLRGLLDQDGDGSISRAEIEKFFQSADANKDGRLSAEELKAALSGAAAGQGAQQGGSGGGQTGSAQGGGAQQAGAATGATGSCAPSSCGAPEQASGYDLQGLDRNGDSQFDLEELMGALLDSDA